MQSIFIKITKILPLQHTNFTINLYLLFIKISYFPFFRFIFLMIFSIIFNLFFHGFCFCSNDPNESFFPFIEVSAVATEAATPIGAVITGGGTAVATTVSATVGNIGVAIPVVSSHAMHDTAHIPGLVFPAGDSDGDEAPIFGPVVLDVHGLTVGKVVTVYQSDFDDNGMAYIVSDKGTHFYTIDSLEDFVAPDGQSYSISPDVSPIEATVRWSWFKKRDIFKNHIRPVYNSNPSQKLFTLTPAAGNIIVRGWLESPMEYPIEDLD